LLVLGGALSACGGRESTAAAVDVDGAAPEPAPEAGAGAGADAEDARAGDDAPGDADAGGAVCAMDLDPTFGTAGITTLVDPRNPAPGAIALQPDGKIVIGAGDPGGRSIAVARFDATGGLDTAFGGGGFAALSPPWNDSNPGAVLVQPDGKIAVVGWDANSPRLARFSPDGALDPSFGQGGLAVAPTQWPNWFRSGALLSDGSILVAGGFDYQHVDFDLLLAKYDRNGVLDPSFGTGGVVTVPGMGEGERLLVLPDGKILVGVGQEKGISSRQLVLARYTAKGDLDTTFGSGGTLTEPPGSFIFAGMALQSTGAIVVSITMGGGATDDFLVLRYTPSGQLDPSFGNGGVARTDFFGARDYAMGLSLLPSDALVVAGSVHEPTDAGERVDVGIVRYTADGQIDTTFAAGGKLVTRLPDGPAEPTRVQALQPDGKLVVAGYGERPAEGGVVRLLNVARYGCR
jgi:uncharacterized delta-60 repeat protein